MTCKHLLLAVGFALFLVSCKKDGHPAQPGDTPSKRVLLKDITIPHLPSPYYHFEYNGDSLPVKVDFASGFFIYDVFYNGNNIAEMHNNVFVNHDTIRYFYDTNHKLAAIKFISDENRTLRHVIFTYNGELVTK